MDVNMTFDDAGDAQPPCLTWQNPDTPASMNLFIAGRKGGIRVRLVYSTAKGAVIPGRAAGHELVERNPRELCRARFHLGRRASTRRTRVRKQQKNDRRIPLGRAGT